MIHELAHCCQFWKALQWSGSCWFKLSTASCLTRSPSKRGDNLWKRAHLASLRTEKNIQSLSSRSGQGPYQPMETRCLEQWGHPIRSNPPRWCQLTPLQTNQKMTHTNKVGERCNRNRSKLLSTNWRITSTPRETKEDYTTKAQEAIY